MNEVTERSGVASGQVDQHISAFHSITNKALMDLGQLATSFDVHGRSLAEAVALIDKSNSHADAAINERRSAIEALVHSLDNRTDDIEQRLKRFSSLLDESLDGATGRAREIARIVADSSAEGARALEQERENASKLLHGIFTLHGSEAQETFAQITDRFQETLDGMRQMAAEMQRELECTRNELRRGILELPQETADSAAQMRRVIVDQIEALAELNRIVARHSRGVDASEPVVRRAPEPAYAGMRAEAPRMEPPPRPVAPPLPMPRTDNGNGQPPAPRRAEAAAPAAPASGTPGGNGWLSELLHRASRPAAEDANGRPPRHTLESLDSLSVDIARMIDHDAAAELWDRYNRGERNVFTKRLYTMQGQATFDDIRRKYRAEREFKQTVDRYIAEFERMLQEVSRSDRGQVVARTYLTSETGKVYTMLAHAAGRFGE
jgi:chaperonin cofactor prefoldin